MSEHLFQEMILLRQEQIERYGHTAESDRAKPIFFFARDLQNRALSVMEDAQFGKPLPQMRIHTLRLAALALATLERIDAELKSSIDHELKLHGGAE